MRPPDRPPVPIFCYMKSFTLEKIISKLSGRNSTATRRNLGGTNLGLRQGCSTGKLPSGRGKSSPSSSPTILTLGGGQSRGGTWRNQSRAPAELFSQGNIPPGGGSHHHRHHQRSSHREGVNLHQHLHQHHLLSNPSSSLVSDLCLRNSDWYL